MPRASRILLVTWDGAGNLPPEMAIVRGLVERGHEVYALSHDSTRERIQASGARFLPIPGIRQYSSLDSRSREEEQRVIADDIWFERGFAAALLEHVSLLRPDLLLVDISLTPAIVAARASGLPAAVLGHFPYSILVGPFAPFFDAHLPAINDYASEVGLPPFSSHLSLIESVPLVLIPSYREFDALETVPPALVHVGPCRHAAAPAPWPRRLPGRPLVLVSLSTSQQNQSGLLQWICDALGGLDVEALVTTGPSIDPKLLSAAPNTTVVQSAPHDDVLPLADLLVTHAGHGTAMAGVTHGVPMLCLPMGRDQPIVAARVRELGLGMSLPETASSEEIASAIALVLANREMRERSRAFAAALATHPGLDHAVALVAGLLPNE